MPANKYALIRYRIIDSCIGNKYSPFPSKEDLRQACEDALYGSHGQNISESTIEKDLYAMRFDTSLGYEAPIEYSRENRGYFYSDPNYSIKRIPLKEEDIAAIQVAANTLVQFRDSGIFQQYQEAISKILDAVAISNLKGKENLEKRVVFEDYPSYSGRHSLGPLFEAIINNRVVNFDYKPFGGKIGAKKAHPLLLKQYDHRWYLIAFDTKNEKIKTFGLERMSNIEVLSERFESKADFEPEIYFKHSLGITRLEDHPAKIRFKASYVLSQYILTRPIHSSLVETKKEESGSIFEMDLVITHELIQWILSQGSQLEILTPQSLRSLIKQHLSETLSLY